MIPIGIGLLALCWLVLAWELCGAIRSSRARHMTLRRPYVPECRCDICGGGGLTRDAVQGDRLELRCPTCGAISIRSNSFTECRKPKH